MQIKDLSKVVKYYTEQVTLSLMSEAAKEPLEKPLLVSLQDGTFVSLKQLIRQSILLKKAKARAEPSRPENSNLNQDLQFDQVTDSKAKRKKATGRFLKEPEILQRYQVENK